MPPELHILSVGYEGGGPVIWVKRGEAIEAIRLTNAEAFALLGTLASAIRFPEAA